MIPIFRGKHYRDNIYFIGSLIGKEDEYYIIEDKDMEYYRPIDITTLAIHFSDMLDSQGNKIFASLSKDGKGGDVCDINVMDAFLEKNYNIQSPILITQKGLQPIEYLGFANFKIIKVIGIQQ